MKIWGGGVVRYVKNGFSLQFLTVRLLKGIVFGEQRESEIRITISRSHT